MRRGLVIGLAMFAAHQTVAAQCRVTADDNEGKLLAFYTAPISFSMATAPQEMPPGRIRIGAEGEYVPKPDPAIEQTGVTAHCFAQKSEHTSLSPVFGRPRLTVAGPFGFAFEAAYLPPVTIARASFSEWADFEWNDANVSRTRHVWKREGCDNVPPLTAAAKLTLEPVLWEQPVERHVSPRYVRR